MSARFAAALAISSIALPSAGASAAEPDRHAAAADQIAWTQACEDWDGWDKPAPPFRIYGNSYYVGTCGIAAILITGDEGHILIDGGTKAGATIIADNIAALGFQMSDVKLLLMSHEHFDHVGGMAALQQLTGAKLLASAQAAPVMESGEASQADPQAGMHDPFDPAHVDGIVVDREAVKLGTLSLLPIATPGHTLGALSWQWQSCEENRCHDVVYADSLSPVSNDTYRFSDHPEYVAAFRAGIARLAELDCDILLTPHPSASGMRDKLVAGELASSPNCRDYAQDVGARLDERLAKDTGK